MFLGFFFTLMLVMLVTYPPLCIFDYHELALFVLKTHSDFANNGPKTSIQTLTKDTKQSAVSHSNKSMVKLKISQMFNSGWEKNAEEERHP